MHYPYSIQLKYIWKALPCVGNNTEMLTAKY